MGSVEADSVALFVGDLTLTAGGVGQIQVFGEVSDASTFGVEILVEILPRAGNRGTVIFTPSPPPDIVPRDDPWPDAGTFTAFDTDSPGFSLGLNGAVYDNGTFLAAPVTYAGTLVDIPVVTGIDASGVWDVVLSTSVRDSSWEGLDTTLTPGTITVDAAVSDWGMIVLTLLTISAGTLVIRRQRTRSRGG